MKLKDVMFVDSFPKIDLHGLDRELARVAIDDFVKDNVTMKNEIIVIVHGFGEGILRATTQETLKNNSSVLKYRIFYNNPGCTIAKLIIDF
jgi:DNA-nicking Smr family endonuclease